MYVFGGMKNGPVGPYADIQPEQAEIEDATVPDEGNDADDPYDEHQGVEKPMYGSGQSE
jgi:hypothetical protein